MKKTTTTKKNIFKKKTHIHKITKERKSPSEQNEIRIHTNESQSKYSSFV